MSGIESALISATGSLVGGMFGSGGGKVRLPNYVKLRRYMEKAGFNPLLGVGPVSSGVSGGSNYMGSAIADAALQVADGMQRKAAQEGEAQKLREQNVQLAKKVQDLTIRPRVGGIYSGNVSTPSLRSAMGVQDEQSGTSGSLPAGGGSSTVSSPSTVRRPDGAAVHADPDGAVTFDPDEGAYTASGEKTVLPALRAFGINWRGSGRFDNAQTIEDTMGDGPLGGFVNFGQVFDTIGHTASIAYNDWRDDARMKRMYRDYYESRSKPSRPKRDQLPYIAPPPPLFPQSNYRGWMPQ
ncbi:hypothetical protein KUV28_00565 [Ferrimonas balearica]|nr:hypothetical protein [Ferrimonas balearica]